MFTKNFVRGMVFGAVLIALSVPATNVQIKYEPNGAALSAGVEPMVNTVSSKITLKADNRVQTLAKYLGSKNSPLAESADTFVATADEYGFNWKLLPAIAGIESNFGRVQLENSYNPFGWGGGYVYFKSFDEAIKTVGGELYERAIAEGADTPRELGPSYCPFNYARWIASVEQFMEEIEAVEI